MSETITATKYAIRSILHQVTVKKKQNILAYNMFHDKPMYDYSIKKVHLDKRTQYN